jgi:hypothetical protein
MLAAKRKKSKADREKKAAAASKKVSTKTEKRFLHRKTEKQKNRKSKKKVFFTDATFPRVCRAAKRDFLPISAQTNILHFRGREKTSNVRPQSTY